MYLQGLGIRHFRSLFDAQIALKPLTIFIGPNGSGKTNLFKALQFLNDAIVGDIRSWRAYESQIDDLLWYGKGLFSDRPEDLRFSLHCGEAGRELAEYRVGFDAVGTIEVSEESLLLRDEQVWEPYLLRTGDEISTFKDQNGAHLPRDFFSVKVRSVHDLVLRDFGPSLKTPLSRQVFTHLAGWRFFDVDVRSARESSFIPERPDEVPALAIDGSNLSAFLYALKMLRPPDMDAVIEALRRSIELPAEILVEHDATRGGQHARYRFIEAPFGERHIPPESMSDGTIRMLAHAALLLADHSVSLACLEEPDSGLHPRFMLHLAAILRQSIFLENENGTSRQILLTTHSPELMDCFDLNEEADYLQVYVVDRDQSGHTLFTPVTAKEFSPWLERYRLGEAVRRNFV